MLKEIFSSLGGRRNNNGRKASLKNIDGHHRRLRHELLEERSMLATLTVSVNSDGALAPANSSLTLREAIAYANGSAVPGAAERSAWINESVNLLGENDVIQFAPSVYGQTITITGANLVVSKRLAIVGPTGANRITIQKGASSTATVGLLFSGFNLSPVGGSVTAQTGVGYLRITGFDTGIELASLTSNDFSDATSVRILGTVIANANTGILLNNADIPFHIESNLITGRSTSSGFGIELRDSGQFLPAGPLITSLLVKPTIGNFDTSK